MFRRIKYFWGSLNLNHIGLLELLFAFTPMLSGYSIGNKPLSVLLWVLLLAIVFFKFHRLPLKNYWPLSIFVIYWSLHTLSSLVLTNPNFNVIITQLIYFLAIYSLYPILELRKLEGALNWVALISIGGLIYQWSIVSMGGYIHPLGIPGLAMSEARLESLTVRPSSFFMEPAAYVAYMMVPLAFSLINGNLPWTILIVLSLFLSTSTTGIIISFIMIGVYMLIQRRSKKRLLSVLLVGVSLYFALTRLDIFSAGLEKYENTEAETNVRLSQGPYIVSTMDGTEYIWGTGSQNAYDYCITRSRAPMVVVYGESVYMSTFWFMIMVYGVVGLILYLNIYFRLFNKSKITLPLITCLIAVLFSSGYCIAGTFTFHLISLLSMAENQKKLLEQTTI